MVYVREEKAADVAVREPLLDEAYGAARFAKASERLREGRLPANGLSLVAVDRNRLLALELRPDALTGVRGLIGATGKPAPKPNLNVLIAESAQRRPLIGCAA